MSTLPAFETLDALPVTFRTTVGEEHLDVNGHMNIGHYFAFGGRAMWDRSRDDLAMPDGYIAERDRTTFTAEQHLRYLGESTLGDEISVPVVVADRGDKSLHLAALILNRTRRELSCVMESMLVHVDFSSRRPVAFPDDVAAAIDAAVEADRTSWPLPLSGSLGVRRKDPA
ncbi:MAG: thioesterase family protein [Aeromicrobium erythreum]